MNVYIVSQGYPYEGAAPKGVFDSFLKAKEFLLSEITPEQLEKLGNINWNESHMMIDIPQEYCYYTINSWKVK